MNTNWASWIFCALILMYFAFGAYSLYTAVRVGAAWLLP